MRSGGDDDPQAWDWEGYLLLTAKLTH